MFDVVVQGVASVRSSVDSVRNLLIDTSAGGHVPLSQIAQVTVQADPIDIQHEALSRYVDVSAPVYGGSVAAERAQIQSALGQIQFPLAYHAEILSGTPDSPTSHVLFVSYVLAAVIGMLLLLQAAFDSWRLAALFLLTLPVALAGGVLVALATGQLSSLGTDAGLLAVFAFAARQGMLQIAQIRRLQRRDGGPLTREIVINAAADRLAPSLTSIVVAAAVMVPFVVMGDVAGNEITHTAAAVILGGLATSTLLNQGLLPALCFTLGPTAPLETDEIAEAVPEIVDGHRATAPSSSPLLKGDFR